jgi:CRISPR system Cascade subunit CasA
MLSGRTRIYTWMSRAVRLLPEDDGHVRFIAYGPGVRPIESPDLDPMCAYRRKDGQLSPYQLPTDRSFWRDFEALLPGQDDWQPPGVLEHTRSVLSDLGRMSMLFPLTVAGQMPDPKKPAKVLNVRREVYPLAARTLEPESASYIRQALKSARETGDVLGRAAWELASHLLPGAGQARKQDIHGRFVDSLPLYEVYWSALERRFPQFLTELVEIGPQPALEGWNAAVVQAARDAWATTAHAVGTGSRHLRALAEAEGLLRRWLAGRAA